MLCAIRMEMAIINSRFSISGQCPSSIKLRRAMTASSVFCVRGGVFVVVENPSRIVIRRSDQFNHREYKQRYKYHLLMSEIALAWALSSLEHSATLEQLEARSSCPVSAVFVENSIESPQSLFPFSQAFLELRGTHIVLYDSKSQAILLSFPCSLDLTFSLRESKGIPQQQIKSQKDQPQTFRLLQFTHTNTPHSRVAFLVEMQHQKSLEYFGILLEKCPILQKDFHSKFKPIRKLGKGSTACVYAAVRHSDSQVVAVKALNKSTHFAASGGKGKKAFEKELAVLASCAHPHLCSFEGAFETENTIYVVMENYEKTLSSLLHGSHPLPRHLVSALMEQLLQAVSHLHSSGLMHRDLKLENIMLQKTENGLRLVIIDMGMAQYYHQDTYLFEHCGTPGFAAPEMFGPRPPHPEKCDIFSLGVVFYILLFKKPVFEGTSSAQVCQNNKAGKMALDYDLIDKEEDAVKDLLMRMLELDNASRISAAQALQHDLFGPSVKTPSLCATDTEVQMPKTPQIRPIPHP